MHAQLCFSLMVMISTTLSNPDPEFELKLIINSHHDGSNRNRVQFAEMSGKIQLRMRLQSYSNTTAQAYAGRFEFAHI